MLCLAPFTIAIPCVASMFIDGACTLWETSALLVYTGDYTSSIDPAASLMVGASTVNLSPAFMFMLGA